MKNLLRAFVLTRRSRPMVLAVYGLNAGLGLLILLPAYATLGTGMGHSMAFTSLLDGLDYTVFSDFMFTTGDTVMPLLSVGRWLGVLWVILSVFLAGGILRRFAQPDEPLRAGDFLAGCTQYAGRFAGVLGVVTLFFGVLFVIVAIVGTLVGAALYNTVSEQVLLYVGQGTTAAALLISALVFCIGDYAKVILFRGNDRNAFRAFGQAGRLVLANPGSTFGPYLLLIGIGTALFGLYFLADDLIGMSSWLTIISLFLVQQALIAARVFLKVWSLGTAYQVSTMLVKPTPVPVTPVPVIDPVPVMGPVEPLLPNAGVAIESPVD